jgi:hypothetical protein
MLPPGVAAYEIPTVAAPPVTRVVA